MTPPDSSWDGRAMTAQGSDSADPGLEESGNPAAEVPDPEAAQALSGIATDLAALRRDFDQIVPALVKSLKENKYFTELKAELDAKTRVANAWGNWPLIVGVHDVAAFLRQEGADPGLAAEQLLDLLLRAGVSEFGEVGSQIDPLDADVQGVEGEGDHFVVTAQHRAGLRAEHVVIRKALVAVQRKKDQ